MPGLDSVPTPQLDVFRVYLIADVPAEEAKQEETAKCLNALIRKYRETAADCAEVRFVITFVGEENTAGIFLQRVAAESGSTHFAESFSIAVHYSYQKLEENRTQCSGTSFLPTMVVLVSEDAICDAKTDSVLSELQKKRFFRIIPKWVIMQDRIAFNDCYQVFSGSSESVLRWQMFEKNIKLADFITRPIEMEQESFDAPEHSSDLTVGKQTLPVFIMLSPTEDEKQASLQRKTVDAVIHRLAKDASAGITPKFALLKIGQTASVYSRQENNAKYDFEEAFSQLNFALSRKTMLTGESAYLNPIILFVGNCFQDLTHPLTALTENNRYQRASKCAICFTRESIKNLIAFCRNPIFCDPNEMKELPEEKVEKISMELLHKDNDACNPIPPFLMGLYESGDDFVSCDPVAEDNDDINEGGWDGNEEW